MYMRHATSCMHNRDALMSMAFEGIGGLGMATIDKFREIKAQEVAAALFVHSRSSGGGSEGECVCGGVRVSVCVGGWG